MELHVADEVRADPALQVVSVTMKALLESIVKNLMKTIRLVV